MALIEQKTSTALKSDLREIGVYTDATQKRKAVAIIGDVCLVDSSGNEIDMTDMEVDLESVSSGAVLIGKAATAHGADFTTAYQAATGITLSNYPAPYTAFIADDIEFVRQISTAGVVTATYTRDDTAMSIAANVLTIVGAAFVNTDTFVVVTNIPRVAASSIDGAGGGNNTYTNANDADFTATIVNGTANITIAGLPFTLEAKNVALGTIVKIAVTTGLRTVLAPTSITVAAGVITLGGIANFVTGDEVAMTLIGPDKSYDVALDNQLVNVQNPDYAHYTDVEKLVDESVWPGLTDGVADAGSDQTHVIDTTLDPFTLAQVNTVIGYRVYSVTDGTYALVSEFTAVDTIVVAGGDVVSFSGDAYKMPVAEYYEINMEGYNLASLHYRFFADLNTRYIMKIYGTLDATATVDDDDAWVDQSTEILGAATITVDGIAAGAAGDTEEDIAVIDMPTTMLKYMVKIVAEGNAAAASASTAEVYVKKSS